MGDTKQKWTGPIILCFVVQDPILKFIFSTFFFLKKRKSSHHHEGGVNKATEQALFKLLDFI